MKNYSTYIYALAITIALCTSAATDLYSQSYTEIKGNMTVYAGSGATTVSNQLFIGPGAVITVTGEWRIASQKIYISPTAVITGAGTIILEQPSAYTIGTVPLAWGMQTLDGGGAAIGCAVEIRNPNGVSLMNITPPAVLGYAADTIADLLLNNELVFANGMIGNNLIANAANVIFASSALALNYSPGHFIVTNAQGNVVRQSLGSSGFIFPVGIDSGDYTPARLLNDGTPDDFSVRVIQGELPANPTAAGIERTWNIQEKVAGGSNVTLTLQHNLFTGSGGPGTSDPLYTDLSAYVSGSQPTVATWDIPALTAGASPGLLTSGAAVANASTLTRSGLTDFSGETRYSKFSFLGNILQAVKTPMPDSVMMGDTFSYHIRVANTGSRTIAAPIVIIDTLPSGAQYLSVQGTGVIILAVGNIITVTYPDTLPRGDSIVFNIDVAALTDTLGNVAFVYAGGGTTPTGSCDTCAPGTPTAPIIIWPALTIPDAFSPNGDGVNDYFVIPDLQRYYPHASLSIYNRNGDDVWDSNGPYLDNFSGVNYSGQVLPVSTYYYVLYYNDGSGRKVAHFLDLGR